MSFSISTSKTSGLLQFDSLLVLTRTALGLGLGMLMADKIKPTVRQAAAVTLLSLGALAAVPFLVKLATEQISGPESDRGSRARLRSIRDDTGGYHHSQTDAY